MYSGSTSLIPKDFGKKDTSSPCFLLGLHSSICRTCQDLGRGRWGLGEETVHLCKVSCWGRRVLYSVPLERFCVPPSHGVEAVAESAKGQGVCGQVQSKSRWFSWRRKDSLEKGGERLRERKGATGLLPVLTFIIHFVMKVQGTRGSHPMAVGRTEMGNWKGRGQSGHEGSGQGRGAVRTSQD